MRQWWVHLRHNTRGTFLTVVLMFGAVVSLIIVGGVSSYALVEHRASNRFYERDTAFHIAEAGINYYRWHLAHSPNDYQDGTGQAGPYIHPYMDKANEIIGYYSLAIDPPATGTTIVTLRSTGWTTTQPESKRTIQVKLGRSTVSDYAFLSHGSADFGPNSVVHGVIHSNGPIRFDGLTDAWVKSAQNIQGGGGPKSFWQAPVAPIDFASVSADVAKVRDASMNGGLHFTSSGAEGYHMVFNGSQFTLYKVTRRDPYNGEGRWVGSGRTRTWQGAVYYYDIGAETVVGTYTIPANGAIFVEDDVWVEGVVDGKVTIGAGRFPVQQQTYQEIYIPNHLTYSGSGQDDVIGLVAQGDIIVPYEAPDTLVIQGALLSQFGRVFRPYYDGNIKSHITVIGSQMSFGTSTWRHYDGHGHTISGYDASVQTYDSNLRTNPPPHFPVNGRYDVISWEEL
ncbi:MAG TPA: pilus assembly PilX N-terminal domain-containing protein [Candidatus Kapabacteria bacterium]|nr:pilus assembly PilX N-terminal domain-containing protein [Candidatus Kapabacteria bacterium]